MGVDFVDIVFRCERVFKIKLDYQGFHRTIIDGNRTDPQDRWTDFQVRDFVVWIESTLETQNPDFDGDVFDEVKSQIVESLQVERSEVTLEAWMVKDLTMS